ncbi:DNA topoisomerase III, partial [human gut metagenome]
MEGGNYIVSWCFGHLVELADASSYDERYAKWRYDDLPIVPESWMFEVTKDKAQQFKVLSSLMKDKRVTELVCATDAGREGELIFRLVYDKAGCTKPFKRLWISSLEDSAIREGFNHLRDGKEYDRLYEAALSRSKADWIVGINGTRLFTTLYHKKLVVGRVQTPTLAMLVERDGKISTFQKEKYFNVHVGKGDLTADLEKVKTEEEAKRIAAACEKKQAVVSSLKRETKTVNPPKLYDLTTLQREAKPILRLHCPADARSRPDALRKEAPDLSAHGQSVHHGRYGGHCPSGYFHRLPPASAFLRRFDYSGPCPRDRQQ